MPTTREIAEHVQGTLLGADDLTLHGMDNLATAKADQLTFIRDASYAPDWATSEAGAAIVGPDVSLEPGDGRALIQVKNADLAVAKALALFAPPHVMPDKGIDHSAIVSPLAKIDPSVRIGPNCSIGRHVKIESGTILHAGVTLMDHAVVGQNCVLYPGVVIREHCTIGDRCILHPNVVIGADGFGYRPSPDGKSIIKIPQIGTVRIDDDVELGACTCVDRGKFAATTIGSHTKIDNLCQIGHNCQIGSCCIIAGQAGLAGSVIVEDGVMMGGKVAIKDHIRIGQGARIAAGSMIMEDVPPGGTWGGIPAQDLREALRQIAAIRKLPDMLKLAKQAGLFKNS